MLHELHGTLSADKRSRGLTARGVIKVLAAAPGCLRGERRGTLGTSVARSPNRHKKTGSGFKAGTRRNGLVGKRLMAQARPLQFRPSSPT